MTENMRKYADEATLSMVAPKLGDSFGAETDKGYAIPQMGGQMRLATHEDHNPHVGRGIGFKTAATDRQEQVGDSLLAGVTDPQMRAMLEGGTKSLWKKAGWKQGGKVNKTRAKAKNPPEKVEDVSTYQTLLKPLAWRMGFAGVPLTGRVFVGANTPEIREMLVGQYNEGVEAARIVREALDAEDSL